MAVTDVVADDYLRLVAEACLLDQLGGCRYVAGLYEDPISGEQSCFVEFCDSTLLTDPVLRDNFTTELSRRFPDVDGIIARAANDVELPPPWQRRITYVRYSGVERSLPSTVVLSNEALDLLVHGWLRQAIDHGYQIQGQSLDEEAARRAATQVLAATGRRSYVVFRNDAPVGHVTLLCEAADEVTGEDHVELYDALVEPCDDPDKPAMAQLVDAAVSVATSLQRPLVGNVVHPLGERDPSVRDRVLHSLLSRGWRVDHTMWWVPSARTSAQAGGLAG
jgi:hypothetical protein